MMKSLDKAMRTDLIVMLRQSTDPKLIAFADELTAAGPYTEATEDEIEKFIELV